RQLAPMPADLMNLVIEKQVFPAESRQGGSQKLEELIQGKNLQPALPILMKAAASFGFVNFHRDAEGGLRYQPQFIEYEGRLYPSLDIQLMKNYLDAPSAMVEIQGEHINQVQVGSYTIPTDPFGRYMLNFDGPRGVHKTVSMVDVIDGNIPVGVIKGK